MILPENHWSLKYERLIKKSCDDFFKGTPVNFFNFIRLYKDGSLLYLSTNNDWHKYYWANNLIKYTTSSRLKVGINYWFGSLAEDQQTLAKEAEERFDISGRIEIVKNYDNYIECFGFAGAKKDRAELIHFYLNNLQKLCDFNTIFLSEFHKIICFIEESCELLPLDFIPEISDNNKYVKEGYHPHNKLKKLIFNDGKEDVILTLTQCKSLAFKLRGYSTKQASEILGLTTDSVNLHMVNIRKKIKLTQFQGFNEKCIDIGIYNVTQSIYHACLSEYFIREKIKA